MSLHANEADLVVALPRNVVGGSDMDVARVESFVQLRLDGLCLGYLLRLQAAPLKHIEEIGVSGSVKLIGPIETNAPVAEQPRQRPMYDGRPDLALDIVADNRDPRISKLLRPVRVRDRKST